MADGSRAAIAVDIGVTNTVCKGLNRSAFAPININCLSLASLLTLLYPEYTAMSSDPTVHCCGEIILLNPFVSVQV